MARRTPEKLLARPTSAVLVAAGGRFIIACRMPEAIASAVSTILAPDRPFEFKLFVEELISNLCRFMHAKANRIAPEAIRVHHEVRLENTGEFADFVVEAPGVGSYAVEVAVGRDADEVHELLRRKYGDRSARIGSVRRLVLVVDRAGELASFAARVLPPDWEVELWDEAKLLALVRDHLGADVCSLWNGDLQEVRAAIDEANGRYAFGAEYCNAPLDAALLWHFAHWRLRELYDGAGGSKRKVLEPGLYSNVAVVFADLTGYSGYVRDTPPSDPTPQHALSFFSAKARYQIINDGGMVLQFQGDGVLGLFGVPHDAHGYVDRSFECAKALLSIGESVSNEWQRQLDRIQPARGCHIGIALGDVHLFPLRPFSRTYLGAVGDAINMAARLSGHATSGQIAVSNLVYRALSFEAQRSFGRAVAVQAKNVGTIQAWTYDSNVPVGVPVLPLERVMP
jgi:class 3 adenylate cyclase